MSVEKSEIPVVVNKDQDQTVAKREIMANQVIREMIETEVTYNKGLALLELALGKPELVNKHNYLKQFQGLITDLKKISDALLKNVNEAVTSTVTEEKRTELRTDRKELLKAFFSNYQSYSLLYNKFLKTTQDYPDQFQPIDQFIRKQSGGKLTFQDYLIMPFQRGPRYQMLIRETFRNSTNLDETNTREFEELTPLIANSLIEANNTMPKLDPYYLGKYTYTFFSAASNALLGPTKDQNQPSSKIDEAEQIIKQFSLMGGAEE